MLLYKNSKIRFFEFTQTTDEFSPHANSSLVAVILPFDRKATLCCDSISERVIYLSLANTFVTRSTTVIDHIWLHGGNLSTCAMATNCIPGYEGISCSCTSTRTMYDKTNPLHSYLTGTVESSAIKKHSSKGRILSAIMKDLYARFQSDSDPQNFAFKNRFSKSGGMPLACPMLYAALDSYFRKTQKTS